MNQTGKSCFISCDWGTSAFRIRLVDATTLVTRAEISEGDGILATFRSWTATGQPESSRMDFYLASLDEHIRRLAGAAGEPLEDLPVVLSGMASASIGMVPLPYARLPFPVDGSGLVVSIVPASDGFRHALAIISGACTASDIMRGEETMLVGALSEAGCGEGEMVVILPGTHSKHVTVRDGKVVDFATLMTGEFFDLLARHSILGHTIEAGGSLEDPAYRESFVRGVRDGVEGDLLHECFSVRSGQVLHDAPPRAGWFRLSGLLIGSELKGIQESSRVRVLLVSGPALLPFYVAALQELAPALRVEICDADVALMRGQQRLILSAGLLHTHRTVSGSSATVE